MKLFQTCQKWALLSIRRKTSIPNPIRTSLQITNSKRNPILTPKPRRMLDGFGYSTNIFVICRFNLSQIGHPSTRSPQTDYNERYKQSVGFTIKILFVIGIIRFFVFVEQPCGLCGICGHGSEIQKWRYSRSYDHRTKTH